MSGTRTVPAKTALWIIGGLVAVILLVVVVVSNGDDGGGSSAPPPSTTEVADDPEVTEPPATDGFDSGIPPIDCRLMMDNLRALDALESDEIGSSFGGPGFSQGEVCTNTVDGFEGYFVTLSPGEPEDFGPGAEMLGVTGRLVPDVGDVALWFAGPEAEGGGDVGVLSVGRETPAGGFFFRIELGRPDLDPDEQLAVASDLATHVLYRFPGAAPEVSEPEVIEPAAPEPIDRTAWSYRLHVEARVEAGEWDWADGVIATLEYLLLDRDDLPGAPDGVVERSVSPFLEWVAASLDEAPEADRATIEALLERFHPVDQLGFLSVDPSTIPGPEDPPPGTDSSADEKPSPGAEEKPSPGAEEKPSPGAEEKPSPGADEDEVAAPAVFAPAAPDGAYRLVAGSAAAQEPAVPDCGGDANVWFDFVCVAAYKLTDPLPADKYVVYAPFPDDLPALGVTKEMVDAVAAAAKEAATTFELVGSMPPVTITIAPLNGVHEITSMATGVGDDTQCDIIAWAGNADLTSRAAAQWIAFEMASCLERSELPWSGSAEEGAWISPAHRYYLSDVVVPDGGIEDGLVAHLRAQELSTTVGERRHANAMFLASLSSAFDPPEMLELVDQVGRPGGGPAAVDDRLAQIDSMPELFHDFARSASDDKLADTAGNPWGGGPFAAEQQLIEGPTDRRWNLVTMDVTRVELVVDPGSFGCVDTMAVDGNARFSWRPGRTTDDGSWPSSPPEVLDGESILLATATGPGSLYLTISDVVDDPADCSEDNDPPEPFEFDLDCPDVCGFTEYLDDWAAEAFEAFLEALGE